MKIDNIIAIIEGEICNTQEEKNINYYAISHLEDISNYLDYEKLDPEIENVSKIDWSNGSLIKTILNGAKDFLQWSEGGLGLISNYDLAKTLLTPEKFTQWEKGIKIKA